MSDEDTDNLTRQQKRAEQWFQEGRTRKNSIERTAESPVETLQKFYTPEEMTDPSFVTDQCELLEWKISKFESRLPEHCERLAKRLSLLETVEESPLGTSVPADPEQRSALTWSDLAEIVGFEEP